MTIRFADGALDLPRFPRARAAGRDQDHVSRRPRQRRPGRQHRRLSRGRRAGLGRWARDGARAVRHAAARQSSWRRRSRSREDGFTLLDGRRRAPRRRAPTSWRKDPAAAAIFLKPAASPTRPGDRLVQTDLAGDACARSRRTAADAFYKGADRRRDRRRRARPSGGILAEGRLRAVQGPRARSRSSCSYRGYDDRSPRRRRARAG